MESFTLLKRRTTELFNSLPEAIKSPTFPKNPLKGNGDNSVKATWEKIHGLPVLARDGHSADVVSGTVYIFGGGSAREINDNAVHAVILPSGSAQADYFAIQAKSSIAASTPPAAPAPKAPVVPAKKEESDDDGDEEEEEDDGTSDEEDDSDEEEDSDDEEEKAKAAKGRAKSMEEISLASPPPVPATSKGKEPASSPNANVPPARKGHATAVIGHRIFLFGGSSPSSQQPLNENGRVWVFDTRIHLWSYLDPVSAIAGAELVVPDPRSGHVAVATTKPDKFHFHHHQNKQKATWREWALGETEKEEEEKGIPQAPVVGVISERAKDKDDEGYGTFIIHGGSGGRKDTWSFDVHSRVWQRLPDAPFAVAKPALALSKSRLYRFARDQLDYLELGVDSFDDFSAADEGEVVITARGGVWKSLLRGKEDLGYKEADPAAKPLTEEEMEENQWPGARSGASLEAVTVGGGREYLVLMFGEKAGGEGGKKYWDDIWAFQVPAEGGSIASATDSILHAVGRKSGEGKWWRVKASAYDDEDDVSAEGPGARGYAASATMGDLEENGIVVWGGLGEGEKRLGDGWILRLG
ncbi:nitrile-specifier protein 2 [Podospora australis]|uniref:Nitrile-specifier protein 2 n=1 Tax=Podospora australis TaxID=1536484 RepID=A0AAN6X269_9PEZI|nr:nitrile-specifier protein 2 [Podospora australis]